MHAGRQSNQSFAKKGKRRSPIALETVHTRHLSQKGAPGCTEVTGLEYALAAHRQSSKVNARRLADTAQLGVL